MLSNDLVLFIPLDGIFTIGYLSMEHYVATISETSLRMSDNAAFAIPVSTLSMVEAQWTDLLTFDTDLMP